MIITQDYDKVNFSFTPLKENNYIKGMSFAYPKYENFKEVSIQLPWILLNKYGIPKRNKYNTKDEEITNIRLPLEENDENIKFIQYFNNLDNQFNTLEFRRNMKINDKYIYVPLIKVNNDNTPSINIKFKTCYETKRILSKVFIESEPIEFNNINELSKIIKLNCKIRCIIRPTKLWVSSTLKKYSITYEMLRCQISDVEESSEEINFL
jgi:hypothetical protein